MKGFKMSYLCRNPRNENEINQKFEEAIKQGRLSKNPAAPNYAGHYMWMGLAVDGKTEAFKHALTREYIN